MPVEIRKVDNVWDVRRMATHLGLPYTTLHGRIRRGSFPAPTYVLGGGMRRYYREQEVRELVNLFRKQAGADKIGGHGNEGASGATRRIPVSNLRRRLEVSRESAGSQA